MLLYLKLTLAVLLVLTAIKPNKLQKSFNVSLILYLLVSSVSFYLICSEIFLVYYSGVEIISGADGQEKLVSISENWIGVLFILTLLYSLPGFLFIPRLKKMIFVIVLLVALSLIPDLIPRLFWDLFFVNAE